MIDLLLRVDVLRHKGGSAKDLNLYRKGCTFRRHQVQFFSVISILAWFSQLMVHDSSQRSTTTVVVTLELRSMSRVCDDIAVSCYKA